MAPALISTPILAAKPQADTTVYLNGLLDDLAKRRDAIPVIPGCSVSISHKDVMELRVAITSVITGFRNQLKWAK